MTTYCRDCDLVHPNTRSSDPWKWRCMSAPVEPGFRYVDPDYSPTPPYDLCSRVNTEGECPMFEPRREAPVKEVA